MVGNIISSGVGLRATLSRTLQRQKTGARSWGRLDRPARRTAIARRHRSENLSCQLSERKDWNPQEARALTAGRFRWCGQHSDRMIFRLKPEFYFYGSYHLQRSVEALNEKIAAGASLRAGYCFWCGRKLIRIFDFCELSVFQILLRN